MEVNVGMGLSAIEKIRFKTFSMNRKCGLLTEFVTFKDNKRKNVWGCKLGMQILNIKKSVFWETNVLTNKKQLEVCI